LSLFSWFDYKRRNKMAREKIVNGVDVGQLIDTINLIKEKPEIAKFKFRATNQWIDGTHCRATVKDFFGAMAEDDSREAMSFEIDEPPILCGANQGANPVEYLLVALSGCLTTTLIAHSAALGVKINKVESRYEGDIDLQGFLGISEDVPIEYQQIRVFFKVDADVSEEKKEDLIRMAQKYSPVFNSVTKGVPVSVALDGN
jgi:uncharacterized OsmC-like protein